MTADCRPATVAMLEEAGDVRNGRPGHGPGGPSGGAIRLFRAHGVAENLLNGGLFFSGDPFGVPHRAGVLKLSPREIGGEETERGDDRITRSARPALPGRMPVSPSMHRRDLPGEIGPYERQSLEEISTRRPGELNTSLPRSRAGGKVTGRTLAREPQRITAGATRRLPAREKLYCGSESARVERYQPSSRSV